MIKSEQAIAGVFVTRDATGALTDAGTGPAGVLYINGAADDAVVTITGSNPYTWSCTTPALTAGDVVQMYITATIATIATAAVVWSATADTKRVSDLNDQDGTGVTLHSDYDLAKTAAQPGEEMDLVNAPNGTAITAIQAGLPAATVTALWAQLVDGTITYGQFQATMLGMIAGLTTGGGTGTLKFLGQNGTTERVKFTLDANRNRLTVTFDFADL